MSARTPAQIQLIADLNSADRWSYRANQPIASRERASAGRLRSADGAPHS